MPYLELACLVGVCWKPECSWICSWAALEEARLVGIHYACRITVSPFVLPQLGGLRACGVGELLRQEVDDGLVSG